MLVHALSLLANTLGSFSSNKLKGSYSMLSFKAATVSHYDRYDLPQG